MKALKLLAVLSASLGAASGISKLPIPAPQETSKDKVPQSQPRTELQKLESERDKLSEAGKFKEALPLALQVVENLRKTRPGSSELGVALKELGNTQAELRLFESAEKSFEECLRVHTAADGPGSQLVAVALSDQGKLAFLQNQFDRAELLCKRAVTIQVKLVPDSLSLAVSFSNLGSIAANRGHWMDAKRYYGLALAIREKFGPESVGVANNLVGVGLAELHLGKLDSAKSLLDRSRLMLQKLSPDSPDMALSLANLGGLALERGRFDEAQGYLEGSLKIVQGHSPNSPDEAKLLANLGVLALARFRMTEGQSYIDRALAIYERKAPNDVGYATILNDLGVIEYTRNHLDKATSYFKRSVAIREKLTPDDEELGASFSNLGAIATTQGRLDEAQSYITRGMAIQERQAPNSQKMSAYLMNIGALAFKRGRLSEAASYLERSLAIREKLAPNTNETAEILNNLGTVYLSLGRLDKAESYFVRSVQIEEQLAPGNPRVPLAIVSLGNLALRRGRLDEANEYYQRALNFIHRANPDSNEESLVLENLGAVAYAQHRLDEAERLCSHSLSIREKLAPETSETADLVLDLGLVAYQRGHIDSAQEYLRKSLAIREKNASGSLECAVTLSDLGFLAEATGDFVAACELHEEALRIKMRLAPGTITVETSLDNLGNIAWRRGRSDLAAKYFRDRVQLVLSLVTREGSSGSEVPALSDEITRIFAEIGREKRPKQAADFYGDVASLRGIGFELESRSRTVERETAKNSVLRAALSKRDTVVKAESRWIQGRSASQSDKEFDDRLLILRAETEQARAGVERILKAKAPRLTISPLITADKIRAKIPLNTELVEYVKVGSWDAKKNEQTGSRYAAYLLSRNQSPKFVQLGDAAEIDADIVRFGELLNGPSAQLRHVGRELYNYLIKPLGKLPRNLLITPDGALNSLSFNALSDNHGRYLIESKTISTLGGGRDLVEAVSKGKPGPSAVMAAPLYETDPAKQALAIKKLKAQVDFKASPSRGGGTGRFEPLPGASREGELVGKALGVKPITGADATEDRLYTIKHPRVLHIATHAVFYPPLRDSSTAQLALEFSDSFASRLQVADDPMLRTALVFAGANEADELRKKGLNDGWATALEISQMELSGTELVVLSGCDTGLGFYKVGEGIYGLQRAFRFAGAQTLIMSLFSVPDAATQKLMARFYKNWKPGMPAGSKLKALRKAQLELLHNPKTRSPKNWAGFVLMGDR